MAKLIVGLYQMGSLQDRILSKEHALGMHRTPEDQCHGCYPGILYPPRNVVVRR